MQDKNQQSSRNAEYFKGKGLGWVPDYPDLRDYNLDDEDIKNNQRLKVDETTASIENLIYELIKSNSKEDTSQNQIDALRNKIFGEVVFKKVRVYKILRRVEEQKQTELKLNKVKFESLLNKQILQLKQYLLICRLAGIFKIQTTSNYSQKNKVNIDSRLEESIDIVTKTIQWMNDEEYDNHLETEVKELQKILRTRIDGIVGLDTYTGLKKLSSELRKYLSNSHNSTDDELQNYGKNDNLKDFKNIKYFPLFSSIPNECFEEILKRLLIEYEKTNNLVEKILDTTRSKNIFENSNLKLSTISNSDEIKNKIFNIRVNIDKKNINIPLEIQISLNDIAQECKHLIEPIICFVIKLISPLSQYRYKIFEELTKEGFDIFENVVKYENTNDSIKSSKIENLYSPQQIFKLQEMAQSAICKVKINLDLEQEETHKKIDELRQLIGQSYEYASNKIEQKEIEIVKKIFIHQTFFYLVNHYLNNFPANYSGETNNDKINPNPFDKQEVFEIVLEEKKEKLSRDEQEEKTVKLSKDQLVLNLNLYVPITDHKILRDLAGHKDERKPFFLLPSVVDLSYWFSPVKDQGSLNSCTAFASVSLLEYFANKNSKDKVEPSAMFLYKAARNKMNVTGDVGASIRETMKVLALFGVPPEEYCPYDKKKIDEEPPAYCYAFARNYKTLKYFLLDYAGISKEALLFQIKTVLAASFPCIFGLTLYSSVYNEYNEKGHIPFPNYREDKVVGGHTLVAVGYDDLKIIKCANRKNYSQGAFLVRNSWGREWGVDGYGWLPYDYVLAGLTAAWWSLIKSEWFNENYFGSSGTGRSKDFTSLPTPPPNEDD